MRQLNQMLHFTRKCLNQKLNMNINIESCLIKYDILFIILQRNEIINGIHEPNDDECDWPEEDDGINALADNVKQVTVSSDALETGMIDK